MCELSPLQDDEPGGPDDSHDGEVRRPSRGPRQVQDRGARGRTETHRGPAMSHAAQVGLIPATSESSRAVISYLLDFSLY